MITPENKLLKQLIVTHFKSRLTKKFTFLALLTITCLNDTIRRPIVVKHQRL